MSVAVPEFDTAHYRAWVLPQHVWVERTATPFATLAELNTANLQIRAFLDAYRRSHCMIIDLRGARGRNDPEFEKAMARHRPPMMKGFERVSLLVETAIGAMHVTRHVAADGNEERVRIFIDEDAARAYVGGPLERQSL